MGNLTLARVRIRALIALFLVVVIFFGGRLIQVQALMASNYRSWAASEMTSVRTLPAPRGDITDINGVAFARSVSAINIVVDQTLIQNPLKTAEFAAPILGLSVDDVERALTGKKRYSMVLKNARPAQWKSLTDAIDRYNNSLDSKELNKRIVGFFSERGYIREYPSGSLVASLVGFVRDDGIGATGLESSMNAEIAGVAGKYSYARGYGAEIPGSQTEIVQAEKGTTIRLTIDRDIQWVAAQAISEAVKNSRAASGTVIVMDPKTGAIVAHATAPTFDPNNTKSVTLAQMRNPAVQDAYEPGSTGKVMTIAAALEERKITPNTVMSVPYALKRADKVFHDHEKHPTQQLTATGILAVSSNTGSIKIGEMLDNDVLYSYLRKFGVGEKTGSGLPGEQAGAIPAVNKWSGTTAPTVAFGQGYSLTAMQATSIFATIANGGVRVSPTVIAGTSDTHGRYTPSDVRHGVRVVSEETARKLRTMMESVVSAQGTAPSAAIPGYRVAGKTGTAQRYNTECQCYSGYTASFIGFAPADAPRYVISVTIQDPKGMHWGGALGGPVFKKVMSFVLQSKHVPPTGTKVKPLALTAAQIPVQVAR